MAILTDQDKSFVQRLKTQGYTKEQAFEALTKVKQAKGDQTFTFGERFMQNLKKAPEALFGKDSLVGSTIGKIPGVSNVVGAVKDTGEGIVGGVNAVKQGLGDIKQGLDVKPAQQEENPFNPFTNKYTPEQTAQKINDVSGGIAETIGGGLEAAFAAPVAAATNLPIVGGAVEKGLETLGGGVDIVAKATGEALATDEAGAEVIRGHVNNLAMLLGAKYGPKASTEFTNMLKTYAGKAVEGVKADFPNLATKTSDLLGKVGEKVKTGTQYVASEAASKATGLSPETMKSIIESPEKFQTVKDLGVEAARMDLFDRTKAALDERITNLGEMGTGYDTIRTSNAQVQLPQSLWTDFLKTNKLSLEDGKIKATGASSIRQPKDLSSLQQVYDLYGGKTKLSADELLNLRRDLDSMSKWEEGKTEASSRLARELRGKIDEPAKKQIPGLKELDQSYAPEIEYLNSIKNLIYDKSGKVKDNAVQTLANLTGKGKEFKLDRLEKLIPDLSADIKAIKALENVEYASGTPVAGYARSGAAVVSAVQGNVPLAIGLALTHPRIIATILEKYGESNMSGVIKKIKEGTKLTKAEGKVVFDVLQRVTPSDVAILLSSSPLVGQEQENAPETPLK